MNKKIKLFFVFLAVSAIVSVLSFFDILGGVRSAKLGDVTKPLLPVEQDTDQDGLSNTDESYWNTDFQNPDSDRDGFLDGEEVASGFDPRVPNTTESGDKLSDILGWSPASLADSLTKNLTDNFTELVTSGIAAGDLAPNADSQTQEKSLQYLSLAVIDDFYKTQDFEPPPASTTEDSSENQIKYLGAISQIIKEDLIDFSRTVDLNGDILSQSSYFSDKSARFNSAFNEAKSLTVPKDWVNIHNGILSLLHRFSLNYKFISLLETDPLKALTAINELINLNVETKVLLDQIQFKIKENKLSLDENIYQILDLIYKTRD